LWQFLYRYALHPIVSLAMHAIALRGGKLARGVAGRRAWRDQLAGLAAGEGELRLHIHAASVGEFEQAKPLVEALRESGVPISVTASFFSPSGYEQQSRYEAIDAASYLPPDTPGEMNAWLDRIAPDLIIIIRYDLWPEFLRASRRRGVPVVLVCGVMREGSSRFRPLLRGFFGELYGMLSLIHAVGDEDARAFARLAPAVPVEVTGDTRYDRVVGRARAVADVAAFTPERIAGRVVLVAGSTWPPDEEALAPLAGRDDLLMVIVPHEPTPEHITSLLERFPGGVTLSAMERGEGPAVPRAVIVDRTGILSALYRVGDIAYVGGGFGVGVHSVLEPAAYGMPVIAGRGIERSRDASEMADLGALTATAEPREVAPAIERLIDDAESRRRLGEGARLFVEERIGATGRILGSLRRRGLLGASEA
jgi:3-deoxy-D-manno-octulosonic-acid transferase